MSIDPRPRYFAGAAASLVAEAVLIGLAAMVALLRGTHPWRVARMPGVMVLGLSYRRLSR